ncbi:unnamed protein product [Brachionus calyciflorus]|uniref:RING-type domain-containing protein n=1 Tax=Brachionus calyciflorus TaxID=104777 RepID=A0A813S0V1_9BILA|nr:unnamed protein product [Brachionus calyciflorus]
MAQIRPKRSLSIEIIDNPSDQSNDSNKHIFPQIDVVRIRQELLKNLNNPNALNLTMDDLLNFQNKHNDLVELEPMDIEINLDELDLGEISSIIPDCDPNFIREQLKNVPLKTPNRVAIIVNTILEAKSYPKLKDALGKQAKKNKLESCLNLDLNIEDFLKAYPNPIEYFINNKKNPSDCYKNHCRTYLLNKYRHLTTECIEKTLVQNSFNFTLTYRQLSDAYDGREDQLKQRSNFGIGDFNNNNNNNNNNNKRITNIIKFQRRNKVYYFQNVPRDERVYPDSIDETFFKELWFIKNETLVRQYLTSKESNRKQRFEKAKQQNALIECQCCFDNEFLPEDIIQCESNHQFCTACIKKYVETNIGDSKYKFKCFGEKCDLEIPMRVIKSILEPNIYEKLMKKIQNEEIKNANLPGLEFCPHCNYAAIIENPDERVFYCQDPDCMKETCRKCNEPNHLPLRCDEIEKKHEVDMRTWIENRVNESMIRVCYKCGKRFYKEEGCNMMHCVCGAATCYVCRQPIKDYSHFAQPVNPNPTGEKIPNKVCPQFSDVHELHRTEMEEAYKKATEEFYTLHPDKKDIKLKHDPKIYLDELAKSKKNKTSYNNIHIVQPGAFNPNLLINNFELARQQIQQIQQNAQRAIEQNRLINQQLQAQIIRLDPQNNQARTQRTTKTIVFFTRFILNINFVSKS